MQERIWYCTGCGSVFDILQLKEYTEYPYKKERSQFNFFESDSSHFFLYLEKLMPGCSMPIETIELLDDLFVDVENRSDLFKAVHTQPPSSYIDKYKHIKKIKIYYHSVMYNKNGPSMPGYINFCAGFRSCGPVIHTSKSISALNEKYENFKSEYFNDKAYNV